MIKTKHCSTCTCDRKFINGIDWHILGMNCGCGQEIFPIADEAGEDCNLYEKINELIGRKCEVCNMGYSFVIEEGNMASKRFSKIIKSNKVEAISFRQREAKNN